jgi:hypothetical protein
LINFNNISLQSDTQLCATTVVDGNRNVVQINPKNPADRTVKKMAAESVVPHPKKKILALKGFLNLFCVDYCYFDVTSRS